MTSAAVETLASCCPSLTALYLERAGRVQDECVAALALGCPHLEVLDLGWCEIGDAALAALAHHCPDLRVLNLAYCDAITDAGVAQLCRGCAHLRSLTTNP